MYIEGHLYSGDGKRWNDNVVAHLLSALEKTPEHIKLDGELYVHGWRLQQINSAIGVNRVLPTKSTTTVGFYIFDAIRETQNFSKRVLVLDYVKRDFFLESCPLEIVPTRWIKTRKEADDFYREAILRKYEGCIYRMPYSANGRFKDTGYVPKRAHWMLKRKEQFDAEFRIVGVTEGRMTDKGGKHVGRLGALICKTREGIKFNVGSGYDDKERQLLWDHPPIGKLLRVQYRVLSEDRVPLEPRSMGLRDYA